MTGTKMGGRLDGWMQQWWPPGPWPEPPVFIFGIYALMALGALVSIDLPPRRFFHHATGMAATVGLLVMGPRMLWIVNGAALGWFICYHFVLPARFKPRVDARISSWPSSTLWGAASFTAGALLAHGVYRLSGPGTYPFELGGIGRDLLFTLVVIVLYAGYLAVAEFGVWYSSRNLPHVQGKEPNPGILYSDGMVVLLLIVFSVPMVYAALAAYQPEHPYSTLLALFWAMSAGAGISLLVRRKDKVVKLMRDLQANERLAAVGEVTARIAHQARHELTLAAIVRHRIARRMESIPAGVREEIEGDLMALEQAHEEISRMLGSTLRSSATGGGDTPVASTRRSFGEILEQEVDHLRPRADERGIRLLFGELPAGLTGIFPADSEKFAQAIFNLIENAVMAARAEVCVDAVSSSGGFIIRVSDDGPGIPPELIRRVTEPFFTTKSGGTGMGLAVARAVALDGGGELELCNRPEGGLEAAFWVPWK